MAQGEKTSATSGDNGRPNTVKVTMNLTEQDRENAEYILRNSNLKNKADAVSMALSLTKYIVEQVRTGKAELVIRDTNDRRRAERIFVPQLNPIKPEPEPEPEPDSDRDPNVKVS